jgi:hypothetical protein
LWSRFDAAFQGVSTVGNSYSVGEMIEIIDLAERVPEFKLGFVPEED